MVGRSVALALVLAVVAGPTSTLGVEPLTPPTAPLDEPTGP